MRLFNSFMKSDAGGVTVEFVAVMPFFLLIVFFVIEVTLAVFWWKTAEKATQLGARLAIVSDPVTSGLPSVNSVNAQSYTGQHCVYGGSPDPCDDANTAWISAPVTCTGSACTNQTSFARIVGRMQNIFGVIKNANVTFTYSYAGMGYAGGQTIPLVTVTLSGIQFQTGFVSIVGSLIGTGGSLVNMPPISARLTGEDLSTSGP